MTNGEEKIMKDTLEHMPQGEPVATGGGAVPNSDGRQTEKAGETFLFIQFLSGLHDRKGNPIWLSIKYYRDEYETQEDLQAEREYLESEVLRFIEAGRQLISETTRKQPITAKEIFKARSKGEGVSQEVHEAAKSLADLPDPEEKKTLAARVVSLEEQVEENSVEIRRNLVNLNDRISEHNGKIEQLIEQAAYVKARLYNPEQNIIKLFEEVKAIWEYVKASTTARLENQKQTKLLRDRVAERVECLEGGEKHWIETHREVEKRFDGLSTLIYGLAERITAVENEVAEVTENT